LLAVSNESISPKLLSLMATPSPRDPRAFEIAIICALPLEANAVIALFDTHWEGEEEEEEEERYGKSQGDPNAYTTGAIDKHNVVVAHMPGMGKVAASGVAAGLRIRFPNIKLALVVGICGGVPYGPHLQQEIYLGDVVISQSLIQYDFGKQYPKVFERKDTLEDSLGRLPLEIRSILAKLETDYHRGRMQDSTRRFLEELQRKLKHATYPGAESDRLFESSYLHQHRDPEICGICRGEDGTRICADAVEMTCSDLGCEGHGLFRRERRKEGQERMKAETSEPFSLSIHIGKMGSGDSVMKSGMHRDEIARKHDVIAFEMEGAGVRDYFPCLVIKGVCDYADSHKNKQWQNYAAAAAAACTRAFLKGWTSRRKLVENSECFHLDPKND
jgi:nucleoside phosphorylase